MENYFGWKTGKDKKYGFKIISLRYKDANNPLHNLEVQITPSIGCNLCKFTVGSDDVIRYAGDTLFKSGSSGNPILYPTPNRVRGCSFDFNGITYKLVKKGKNRYIHGLVYDEEWKYDLPLIQEDCVVLKTWIDFSEESPMYQAFPFKHRLIVEFRLYEMGIKLIYSVENYDDKNLPFGFALHPFFEKLSGDNGTYITIPADYVMESTPDCLPTGKVIKVGKTRFDIRKPKAVGELDIDHNYIGMKSGLSSTINYENKLFYLSLDTSDDFTHLVLFTPQGERFFCLENQTCSTDAHNLYSKGYQKESGLIIVSPGYAHKGYVMYSVHFK